MRARFANACSTLPFLINYFFVSLWIGWYFNRSTYETRTFVVEKAENQNNTGKHNVDGVWQNPACCRGWVDVKARAP